MFNKSPSLNGFYNLSVVNKEQSDRMKEMQAQQRAKRNKSEDWADEIIKTYGLKYTRQAIWQARLFDFWFGGKGIALEIDGQSHTLFKQKLKDSITDNHFYMISGIIVLRVKEYDERALRQAMAKVCLSEGWKERRIAMGIFNAKQRRKQLGIPLKNKCRNTV